MTLNIEKEYQQRTLRLNLLRTFLATGILEHPSTAIYSSRVHYGPIQARIDDVVPK